MFNDGLAKGSYWFFSDQVDVCVSHVAAQDDSRHSVSRNPGGGATQITTMILHAQRCRARPSTCNNCLQMVMHALMPSNVDEISH